MKKPFLGVVVLLLLGLLTYLHARGAPPEGADPNSPLAKWYQSLHTKNGTGCCSLADCREAKYRQTPTGYDVFLDEKWHVEPAHWQPVPSDAILERIPNPTGSAVVCALPNGAILCFVRETES